MKLNKLQLGLLYLAVSDEIDTYTRKDIALDGVKYAQLNLLLSEIEKEINK